MSDIHSPAQRHRNMAAIHSASTRPELKLRHALWRRGFRYRVNDRKVHGKPDIVLPKYRTVIFIHGCFWHGHKGCRYYVVPKTNTDFWMAKIARNQERDQEVWRQLEAQGWAVIVVWECQLKRSLFDSTIDKVVDDLENNRLSYLAFKQERQMALESGRMECRERKLREKQIQIEIQERIVSK